MIRVLRWSAAFAVVIALIFPTGMATAAQVTPRFEFSSIGTLAGTGDGRFDDIPYVWPVAINDSGMIVATVYDVREGGCCSIAFTNDHGDVRQLTDDEYIASPYALNNAGHIVGIVQTLDDDDEDGAGGFPAVVWRDGVMAELPDLDFSMSWARAINDRGQIAGTLGKDALDPLEAVFAVMWTNDVPALLGPGMANDLNEDGVVVGVVDCGWSAECIGVRWLDGTAEQLDRPLAHDGVELFTWPNAINADGVIVGDGYSNRLDDVFYPVVWRDGGVDILPTFGEFRDASAVDINDAGQIVGNVGDRAVIWQGDQVIDLNSAVTLDEGLTLRKALSINNAGQILVQVEGPEGLYWGGLLTPTDIAVNAMYATHAVALTIGRFEWVNWLARV